MADSSNNKSGNGKKGLSKAAGMASDLLTRAAQRMRSRGSSHDDAAADSSGDDWEEIDSTAEEMPSFEVHNGDLSGHELLTLKTDREAVAKELKAMVPHVHRWRQLYKYCSTLQFDAVDKAYKQMDFAVPDIYGGIEDAGISFASFRARLGSLIESRRTFEGSRVALKMASPVTSQLKKTKAWSNPVRQEDRLFIGNEAARFVPNQASMQTMVDDIALWKDLFELTATSDLITMEQRVDQLRFEKPVDYDPFIEESYKELHAQLKGIIASRKAYRDASLRLYSAAKGGGADAAEQLTSWQDPEVRKNRKFLSRHQHYLALPLLAEMQGMVNDMGQWKTLIGHFQKGHWKGLDARLAQLHFVGMENENPSRYALALQKLLKEILTQRRKVPMPKPAGNIATAKDIVERLRSPRDPLQAEVSRLLGHCKHYSDASSLEKLQAFVKDVSLWEKLFEAFAGEDIEALDRHISKLVFSVPKQYAGCSIEKECIQLKEGITGILMARKHHRDSQEGKPWQDEAREAHIDFLRRIYTKLDIRSGELDVTEADMEEAQEWEVEAFAQSL